MSSAPPSKFSGFSLKSTAPARTAVKTQITEESAPRGVAVSTITSSTLQQTYHDEHNEVKKDIIIPLIKQTQWRNTTQTEIGEDGLPRIKDSEKEKEKEKKEPIHTSTSTSSNSLDDEAAAALVTSATKEPEKQMPAAIPLLLQNAVPGIFDVKGGEQEKYQHDLTYRPDDVAPTSDAYDRVPIESFGIGMLRGMGWKGAGDPIGGTNKAANEAVDHTKNTRGHRQGLGASMSKPSDKKPPKYMKPGDEKQNQSRLPSASSRDVRLTGYHERLIPLHALRLRVGALVEFVDGTAWARQYGRVHKIHTIDHHRSVDGSDYETQNIDILLNKTEEKITCPQHDITIVDENALPLDHPALTQTKKRLDEEKRKAEERAKEKERETEKEREKEKEKKYKQERDSKHKRERSSSPDRDHKKHKSSSSSSSSTTSDKLTWIVPNIRVRIVSASLHKGKHYGKKGRIIDVLSPTTFILSLDDGTLIEDARERHVETILPAVGGRVRFVVGQHKHEHGRVLSRDSQKSKAVIQLDDMDVVTVSFDDVAETVGEE